MKPWLKDIVRVDVLPRPTGTDLRYSEWLQELPPRLFRKFIKTLTWEDFALYPDTNILKNKIAEHHSITPINIYLAPGSAEALRSVFDCLNLGESVLTTDPCFPMYDVYARQNSLHVTKIKPLDDLSYKLRSFIPAKLIIFSRPSNPLGYFFKRKDIIKILEDNPQAWVLVDEAYIDYVENKDEITDLIHVYDNLIISRSFSKTFGAAGCRVGYLMSNSKNIDIISKFRQMYEISGPSMKYALFLLEQHAEVLKYCKKTIRERKKLCKLFRSAKLDVAPSHGNWIHVQQTPTVRSILEKHNVHVKYDITLPTKIGPWMRITVGPGTAKLFKEILN
jgi:histidinol-phosphate aminotransferase